MTSDRKSTRLNSSHSQISYAVFCLKKKKEFCTLPVSIIFEPLYYFSAQEAVRNFSMAYDLQGIDMLPVLLVPGDELIQKVCAHYYSAHKRIVLHYQHILPFKSNSPQAFVYHFTFLLLAYTCLKML